MKIKFVENFSTNRNWISIYFASLISNAGNAITAIALPVLIYQTSGSTLHVGLTFVLFTLPGVIFGPFVGVITDSQNKKMLMILSDLIRALLVSLIPISAIYFNVYTLFILLFTYSCVNRIFAGSLTTMIPMIVNKEKLQTAISLLATSTITAKVLGYLLAGTIVSIVGVKICFFIDSFTYFVSAALISCIHLKHKVSLLLTIKFWNTIKDGYVYSLNNQLIQGGLLLLTVLYFCIEMQPYLLFAYVLKTLNYQKIYYSYFCIAIGLGNLAAALLAAKFAKKVIPSTGLGWAYLMTGVCYVVFASIKNYHFNLLVCFCIGMLLTAGSIFWLSIFHLKVEQKYKGRVWSFLDPIFGLSSTMSFIMGTLIAENIGPDKTFFILGWIIIIHVISVMWLMPTKKAFIIKN